MALATLSIDIVAQLAKMEQGFDKANRISEKFAADQERRFSAVKGAAVAIGGALGAAFSVTQIASFVRATIDGLDALNDLKDATGASIENISALEDVAARTGTSFDSMSSTLVKFNKVLGDSKPGSEAANTIKLLGLNAEELKRIDPAEALRQAAVALAGFADDGNKARIIQELFGKSVAEAAPFLKDLAEQGQLNATVTAAQAQAAEDFNKQMFQLQKNATDASRAVVGELLPGFNKLVESMKNAQGPMERVIAFLRQTGIGTVGLKWVGIDVFGKTQEEQVGNLQRDLAATNKLLDEGNISEDRRLRLLERRKILERDIAALTIPQASYSNEGRTRPAPSIGDAPGATTPAKVSELAKYIERLEQAQVSAAELTEVERAMYMLETGQLGKVNAQQREYVLLLARGIDLSKEKADLRGPEIDAAELERRNALERELNAIRASTPTAVLRREFELFKAIDGQLKNNTISLAEYRELLATAFPEMERSFEKMEAISRDTAAGIEDTLGSNVRDALKGDFDNILESWENLLADMIAKAAQAELARQLFGSYTSGGNLGGLVGALFGGADAGSGTSLGGPTIDGGASGGYVTPSSGGRMSAQRAAPTVLINQTVNVGQGVSRGEVEAAVRAGNAQTQESIRRSLQQGRYS